MQYRRNLLGAGDLPERAVPSVVLRELGTQGEAEREVDLSRERGARVHRIRKDLPDLVNRSERCEGGLPGGQKDSGRGSRFCE